VCRTQSRSKESAFNSIASSIESAETGRLDGGRCAQHTTAGDVCAAACPGMAGEMLARPPPCSAALVRAARRRGVSVLDVPALAFDEAHDDDGLVLPLPPLLKRQTRLERTLGASEKSAEMVLQQSVHGKAVLLLFSSEMLYIASPARFELSCRFHSSHELTMLR
jgi:hypothetical protein